MLCVAADFDALIWRSKDVPPSDLFLEERALISLYPSKNAMFRWFWEFRCRFDLIDREKYWNPRSMNFQRATAHFARHCRLQYWMEKILFSLFSVRVSLSLVDLSVRPSRGSSSSRAGPEVIGGERRIHWKRRLLSGYELRREDDVDIERCGVQWQRSGSGSGSSSV